jgi:non-ribosomal peptide synthetase component E (peptide arylation enzyme)
MEEETLTLTALLKAAAAAHPSRRAIAVHGKIDLTHADLDALVDAAAARLHTAGVRPGQTVALCFPNTVEVNTNPSVLGSIKQSSQSIKR